MGEATHRAVDFRIMAYVEIMVLDDGYHLMVVTCLNNCCGVAPCIVYCTIRVVVNIKYKLRSSEYRCTTYMVI